MHRIPSAAHCWHKQRAHLPVRAQPMQGPLTSPPATPWQLPHPTSRPGPRIHQAVPTCPAGNSFLGASCIVNEWPLGPHAALHSQLPCKHRTLYGSCLRLMSKRCASAAAAAWDGCDTMIASTVNPGRGHLQPDIKRAYMNHTMCTTGAPWRNRGAYASNMHTRTRKHAGHVLPFAARAFRVVCG